MKFKEIYVDINDFENRSYKRMRVDPSLRIIMHDNIEYYLEPSKIKKLSYDPMQEKKTSIRRILNKPKIGYIQFEKGKAYAFTRREHELITEAPKMNSELFRAIIKRNKYSQNIDSQAKLNMGSNLTRFIIIFVILGLVIFALFATGIIPMPTM